MVESHVIHTMVGIAGLAFMYLVYQQIKREIDLTENVKYLSALVDEKSYDVYHLSKNADTLREEVVHLSELATLALYKGDK